MGKQSVISARPVTPEDERLFREFLENDPLHQALGIKFSDLADCDSYLVSGESGPLLFARLHLSLRAAMQFNPATPYRTAKHAQEVVQWLEREARQRQCREIIIRPGAKAINLAERLGFKNFNGGKYIRLSAKVNSPETGQEFKNGAEPRRTN